MARKRPAPAAPRLPPPDVAPPSRRRLQVYALDPAADQSLGTAGIARTVLSVRWEPLTVGPVGEYVEVVDVDPSSGCAYDPVDLDHPHLAAQDGHRPSEGNPHFHQQMVYAVVMKTVENFETALGRPVQWADRRWDEKRHTGRPLKRAERFVQRLRVYPHALREANAYYSPAKKALLFGYFNAPTADPRDELPGGMVFTCLSHDVIAHETAHAILDGIHPRLLRPSNGDMLAFHEGFADVVAIFQHFTLPGLLFDQIQRTRGDLGLNNLLAQLAGQFGRATKRGGALRNALGEFDAEGRRVRPQPATLAGTTRPHDRGAVLVAAVFDAFLRIYEDRIRDLKRIASEGSGILRPGDLHPDLARRFADEAVKAAQRVLTIAVRALDYLPPVDVTFGDYLRALITADFELVPDDTQRHRVAFVEAFRERGILPDDVRSLGEDSLRWHPASRACVDALAAFMPPPEIIRTMLAGYEAFPEQEFERKEWQSFTSRDVMARVFLYKMWMPRRNTSRRPGRGPERRPSRREKAYLLEGTIATFLHRWLKVAASDTNDAGLRAVGRWLGLDLRLPVEVHDIRPTYRVRDDGRTKVELVVVLTQKQSWRLPAADAAGGTDGTDVEGEYFPNGTCTLSEGDWSGEYPPYADDEGRPVRFTFRGGCTLVIDPESGELRYAVTKNVHSTARRNANARFYLERLAVEGPGAMARYSLEAEAADGPKPKKGPPPEPFALTHRDTDTGDD